jgi:hypothetical protein
LLVLLVLATAVVIGHAATLQPLALAQTDIPSGGEAGETGGVPALATPVSSHDTGSPLASTVSVPSQENGSGDDDQSILFETNIFRLLRWLALNLAAILALLYSVWRKGIKPWMVQTVRGTVSEHFNQVNPGKVPIYVHDNIPRREDLFELLKRMGFEKVTPFGEWKELGTLEGCIVYRFLKGTSTPDWMSPDEEPFLEFLKAQFPLDAAHVGFVIFTPPSVRGSDAVTEAFPTITYANSVATIATNALTIARSLTPYFASKTT